MSKIDRIFLVILSVIQICKCDKYIYANYFDYSKLPSFGLNPDHPLEAIEILRRNKAETINILGAFNGLMNIAKSQNQSLPFVEHA